MESVLGSVAVYSAVIAAYLAVRGVPLRRIGGIFRWGAIGGAALGLTLGLFYGLIAVWRPLETFAFLFMVSLAFAAAVIARDQILGSIGPLGIIFLNIAVNFAPETMPWLKLSWLEIFSDVEEHWRLILDPAARYLPALLALLYLLFRGGSLCGFLMGLWACWICIVTLAGPAWDAFTQFRPHDLLQWLWLLSATYAAVHVGLLALNIAFATSDRRAARAMARSVRIEERSILVVLLWASCFWVAMDLLHQLSLPAAEKTAYAIALALMLDWLLAAKPPAVAEAPAVANEEQTPPKPFLSGWSLQGVMMFAAYTLVLFFAAKWSWEYQLQRHDLWISRKDFQTEAEIVLLVSTSYFIVLAGLLVRAAHRGSEAYRESGKLLSVPLVPGAVLIFVVLRLSMTPLWPGWERDIAWQNPGIGRLAAEQAPCRLVPAAGGGILHCGTHITPVDEARPSSGPPLAWAGSPQRFYRVEYAGALPPAFHDAPRGVQPTPARRSILCIETQLHAGTEAIPGLVLVPRGFDRGNKTVGVRALYDKGIGCDDLMQAARSQKFVYRFRNLRREFERPSGEPRRNAGLARI